MSIIIHLGHNFLQNGNSFVMFSDYKNGIGSLQIIQKIQKNRKNNNL